MSDEIKPALTPEDWAKHDELDLYEKANFIAIREGYSRHALAALLPRNTS